MPMRALVVLLVVLNLGIAAWWMSRPSPAPIGAAPPIDGVPRLRLLDEAAVPVAAVPGVRPSDAAVAPSQAASDGTSASAAPAATPTAVDAPAPAGAAAAAGAASAAEPAETATATAPVAVDATTASTRCFTAGPFADAAARDAARARLASRGATGFNARETTDATRGWRVAIAPQADRAAAEALADRIRAAGIDDYMIVPSGSAEANGIALGRYGGERAARARETALRDAGFATATAQPVGAAVSRLWLDLQAGTGVDLAAAGVDLAARRCSEA